MYIQYMYNICMYVYMYKTLSVSSIQMLSSLRHTAVILHNYM